MSSYGTLKFDPFKKVWIGDAGGGKCYNDFSLATVLGFLESHGLHLRDEDKGRISEHSAQFGEIYILEKKREEEINTTRIVHKHIISGFRGSFGNCT